MLLACDLLFSKPHAHTVGRFCKMTCYSVLIQSTKTQFRNWKGYLAHYIDQDKISKVDQAILTTSTKKTTDRGILVTTISTYL
jgi:hypothetical protein